MRPKVSAPGGLAVRRAHHLAPADFEAGELRQTAAADDRQHRYCFIARISGRLRQKPLASMPQPKTKRSGMRKPTKSARNRFLRVQRLLDQHRAMHALGAELEQPFADRRHRLPVVEDVVQHQHRAPLHQLRRPHAPFDPGAARCRAIARGMHIVEVEREVQLAAGSGRRTPPRRPSPPAPADSACRARARSRPPAGRPRPALRRRW